MFKVSTTSTCLISVALRRRSVAASCYAKLASSVFAGCRCTGYVCFYTHCRITLQILNLLAWPGEMKSCIAWLKSFTGSSPMCWSTDLLKLECVTWHSFNGWQQMLFQRYFMVMSLVRHQVQQISVLYSQVITRRQIPCMVCWILDVCIANSQV